MSRENKVNPGIYTQRGRLSQDDASREMRKQGATGSPHPGQPGSTRVRPAPPKAAARPSDRATRNAKADPATTPAAAQTAKPTRKAALARNAGGPGGAPRR